MEDLLGKLKEIAKKHKFEAYSVGGIVRDKLLNVKWQNPDITIEGDGIIFARIIQRELGGKLILHSDFGTATLISESFKIDIASCRSETYPAPAELPVIKKTNLHEDLKRRDFTINAMAMKLSTDELIDPFNGQKDLKLRIIRIMHPKSFEDDPTRIFRAVRFAGKLGLNWKAKPQDC